MPQLEELVRDAVGDLVGPVTVESVMTAVSHRRERRRRVRRATLAAMSVAAVGVAALGVTGLGPHADRTLVVVQGRSDPVEPEPAPASPPPEPNGGFALWPEDTPSEWAAAGEKPAWRNDSVETARRFAAEVLGWTDTEPVQVMTDAHGRHYRVEREPGGPGEIIHMELLTGCSAGEACDVPATWSVLAVSDDPVACDDPAGPGCLTVNVAASGSEAHIEVGMLDAASVDVELSSGTAVRGSTTTGDITLTLTLDRDPADPGFLLLLYRDEQGRVSHAFGYTLGPQDLNGGN
jgi:hypothetical protein